MSYSVAISINHEFIIAQGYFLDLVPKSMLKQNFSLSYYSVAMASTLLATRKSSSGETPSSPVSPTSPESETDEVFPMTCMVKLVCLCLLAWLSSCLMHAIDIPWFSLPLGLCELP